MHSHHKDMKVRNLVIIIKSKCPKNKNVTKNDGDKNTEYQIKSPDIMQRNTKRTRVYTIMDVHSLKDGNGQ